MWRLPWWMSSLRNHQRKKSSGVHFGRVRWPFHFNSATDETFPKLFTEPCHGNISSVKRNTSLINPLSILIKVLTPSWGLPIWEDAALFSTVLKHPVRHFDEWVFCWSQNCINVFITDWIESKQSCHHRLENKNHIENYYGIKKKKNEKKTHKNTTYWFIW